MQYIKARLPREESIKCNHIFRSSLAEGSLCRQIVFEIFSCIIELVEVEKIVSNLFDCHLLVRICLNNLRLTLLGLSFEELALRALLVCISILIRVFLVFVSVLSLLVRVGQADLDFLASLGAGSAARAFRVLVEPLTSTLDGVLSTLLSVRRRW